MTQQFKEACWCSPQRPMLGSSEAPGTPALPSSRSSSSIKGTYTHSMYTYKSDKPLKKGKAKYAHQQLKSCMQHHCFSPKLAYFFILRVKNVFFFLAGLGTKPRTSSRHAKSSGAWPAFLSCGVVTATVSLKWLKALRKANAFKLPCDVFTWLSLKCSMYLPMGC